MKKMLLNPLLRCFGVLFLALNLSAPDVRAQATTAAGYYFKASSGTYSYLSGGTDLNSIEVDDGVSSSISIGFTFKYCGTDYTSLYVSSNGWISFTSSYVYCYPGTTTYLGSAYVGKGVMPLWDDVSGDAGTASYTLTGSAPNRVFTVEWKDWKWDYSATSPGISFQVKLYETTNVIQFIYKQESGSLAWDYTTGGTIGISGGSSTDYLTIDNTSSSASASSSVFTNTLMSKPATGQIFQFAPLPDCAGKPSVGSLSGPAAAVCPGANFTLAQISPFAALGATFKWQSSPAGAGTWSDVSGATDNSLTTSITANIDFRLIINCTYSGLSDTSPVKTINVVPKPIVTTSGPTTFCANQWLKLSTSAATGISYQWVNSSGLITGATSADYLPSASGKFAVRASTSLCTSGVTSDSVNVTVLTAPVSAISPAPTVTFCAGGNVLLTGSGSGNYQWRNSGGLIPGATSATLTTSSADLYTLIVTNTTTGCKDTSDPVTVISSPPPTASISPAGGSPVICSGYAFILTSATTGSGLTYQWFNGAGAISGATSASYTGTASGPDTYSLVVTAGTCTDTSNVVSITLHPLPPAAITSIGATSAVCPGGDVRLEANMGTGYTYQWQEGGADISAATARVYNVMLPGDYTVKVTDINNCTSTSATYSVINNTMSKPAITPKDVSFCEGAGIMLFSNPDTSVMTFQWNYNGTDIPGATAKTQVATSTGRYGVVVTDRYNCKLSADPVTITAFPLPNKPVVAKIGYLLATTTFYETYQWYRNGVAIPGAVFRNYNYTYDGRYWVVVGDIHDCHISSDTLIIDALSVKDPSGKSDVRITPNPTTDKVTIAAPFPVHIVVTDVSGRKVVEAEDVSELHMAAYGTGLYLFTISDKEGKVLTREKVIVR